jgi:hypothetical protein
VTPQGKFKSQALLCTDLTAKPEQILKWFVMRWQLEVTFHEVRDHLGVETQSSGPIGPSLAPHRLCLGCSRCDLVGQYPCSERQNPCPARCWYSKPLPTFSDAMALVRQELRQHRYFQLSQDQYDVRKVQPELLNYLRNAAFYTP